MLEYTLKVCLKGYSTFLGKSGYDGLFYIKLPEEIVKDFKNHTTVCGCTIPQVFYSFERTVEMWMEDKLIKQES